MEFSSLESVTSDPKDTVVPVSLPTHEVFVADEAEFSEGDRRIVTVVHDEVGVFRIAGEFYAWRNECPHQGGPICQGRLMRAVEERLDENRRSLGIHYVEDRFNIVCPWHGFEFDARTGRHAGIPQVRLTAYPVTVREGRVYVRVAT